MITIGIDYSYTSPAMCVHDGDTWSIDNCTFYVINDKKLLEKVSHPQFKFSKFKPYIHRIERFTDIANHFCSIIDRFPVKDIAIEGYSMNSKSGAVCDISENGGILRHTLYRLGYGYTDYAPTSIKKFATGKGNSKKESIYESFVEETGIDSWTLLFQPKAIKIGNPLSDIVDAYYIAKKHFDENN